MAKQPRLTEETVTDETRAYFVLLPHYVHYMCSSPHELALWIVYAEIAGEDGECTLDTNDVATLAMMSAGMVDKCRKSLLRKGLLEGELRKDPGQQCSCWHIRIPDLWPVNVRWRQQHHKLKGHNGRIAFKRRQRELFHQVKEQNKRSSGEISRSPGETKKNPEEEPGGRSVDLSPIWHATLAELELQMTRATFTTWIVPIVPATLTRCAAAEAQAEVYTLVLECDNTYVLEWCEHRLHTPIARTVAGILQIGEDQLTIEYRHNGHA